MSDGLNRENFAGLPYDQQNRTSGLTTDGQPRPPATPLRPGGHECSFPLQPPRGSFFAPGPCETCGKTQARAQAEQMLAAAHAAMAAAEPGPDGTPTPGRAIWESLIETAVEDFGRPAGDFESWDAAPPDKRRRMEAAGLEAVAAYIDANGRDPVDAETTLLEAIGRPGYWQARTALTTATHALVMIAAGDDAKLAGQARDTLGQVDAIMSLGGSGAATPIPPAILGILTAARADIAWIWRETTDERAKEKANRALHRLSDAGVHTAESDAEDEDAQRAADLRSHASGQGGPSPAQVGDDAAGLGSVSIGSPEDGEFDDCEPTL